LAEALASPSVAQALAAASERLVRAGCDTPRLDAELLLAFALGVDRAWLLTHSRAELPDENYERLVARREAREPIAYIVGHKAFRRISLAVDRRVLIPRPETELLVEVGLGLPAGARVADVGTGSGAVALALKDERPDLYVTGLDSSAEALQVARANAGQLGLEVRFALADLLDGSGYDAVLANLPYVPAGVALAPEIARYEPPEALFAGEDGLDVIRRLVGRLGHTPLVALEVGLGQAADVMDLLGRFGHTETRRDLSGHERVVIARQ
jgi:release factor glutamine methyltransferase